MKSFQILAVLFLILFVSVPFVSAEEESSTLTPTKRVQEMMRKEDRMEVQNKVEKRGVEKRVEIKEGISSRSAAFKEKLKTIQDGRKKEVTQRIQTKLADINKKRITHYREILKRLSNILVRLEEKNPDLDIEKAKQAIVVAQAAVDAQAAKEYIPAIKDENTLRQTVGSSMTQLQKDLQTTKLLVQAAKDAVMEVAKSQKEVKITPTGEVQE